MKIESKSDSTHTIFASARYFFSGTALSRVTGLLRDIAMAAVFGTGETIAAFMVAFRFSHTPRRLFGEGALQSAFAPHFEELRHENSERSYRFFYDLLASWALMLMLLVLVTMGVLWGCVSWLDVSEENRSILNQTFLMMPSLLFICLYGLNTSLLQCEGGYFISSVAPVAFNCVWMGAVLWIGFLGFSSIAAMSWLSFAIIIACCCQWLVTVPQVWGILSKQLIKYPKKPVQFFSPDVRRMMKPLFLGITGVAAVQINSAVDAIFARYADPSGPAYLWYAIRLQQLPLALFGIALSGALLPPLSRAIKASDFKQARDFLEFSMSRSVALMLPMTCALFVMGDACINAAYGRGGFNALSILGTTQCLWGYAVGLIPMTLILVMAPAFYAQGNYRIPTWGSLFSVVLNILLNAFFVLEKGYGAASVAYATSISAWCNFLFLSYFLLKNNSIFYLTKSFYKGILKTIAMTLGMTFLAFGIGSVLFNDRAWWNILINEEAQFSNNFLERIANVFVKGLCFIWILIPALRTKNLKIIKV